MSRLATTKPKADKSCLVPAFRYPGSSNGTGLKPLTFTDMMKYVTKKDFDDPEEAMQKYIRCVYLDFIDKHLVIKPGEEEKAEELRVKVSQEKFPVYLVPSSIFGDGLLFCD